MDLRLFLRMLERTAENLQLVQTAADIRQVGQQLSEDVQYLRDRFGRATVEPPDLDTKT